MSGVLRGCTSRSCLTPCTLSVPAAHLVPCWPGPSTVAYDVRWRHFLGHPATHLTRNQLGRVFAECDWQDMRRLSNWRRVINMASRQCDLLTELHVSELHHVTCMFYSRSFNIPLQWFGLLYTVVAINSLLWNHHKSYRVFMLFAYFGYEDISLHLPSA